MSCQCGAKLHSGEHKCKVCPACASTVIEATLDRLKVAVRAISKDWRSPRNGNYIHVEGIMEAIDEFYSGDEKSPDELIPLNEDKL